MYMTAQDLTCPGASLIHSAGIAAHVSQVDTLESNAREYVPAANSHGSRISGCLRFEMANCTLES